MEEQIIIKAYEEICTVDEILGLTEQGLLPSDQALDMIKRLIWNPQSSLGLSRGGYLEEAPEEKAHCFACGVEKDLTRYKDVWIETNGNPVKFDDAYFCKDCQSRILLENTVQKKRGRPPMKKRGRPKKQ